MKKTLLYRSFILLVGGVFYGILCIYDIPCLFRHFTGVICPGCGMGRALYACLCFDFKTAFQYHPMVFSLPLLLAYFFTEDGRVFKNKVLNNLILSVIGIGFLVNYTYNLLR